MCINNNDPEKSSNEFIKVLSPKLVKPPIVVDWDRFHNIMTSLILSEENAEPLNNELANLSNIIEKESTDEKPLPSDNPHVLRQRRILRIFSHREAANNGFNDASIARLMYEVLEGAVIMSKK